jgi:hypothetical protein
MDDLLQEGIKAYQAGNRDDARKLFVAAVKQNQNDERVWGWMYNVCDTDKERIHCLKRMIHINPKNEKANQLLAELIASDFPLERPAMPPLVPVSQSVSEQKPPTPLPPQTQKTIASKKPLDPKQQKNLQISIVAILLLCIICSLINFMPKKSNTPSSDPKTNLCATIDKKLGTRNTQQDVKRMTNCNFDQQQAEISVTFIGNENFTHNMTIRSVQLDMKDVLQVISQSNTSLPYHTVVIVVTYPYVDIYGNVTDTNVVIATYNRENIEKVTWDTFLTDNIYILANQDSLYVHRDFIP